MPNKDKNLNILASLQKVIVKHYMSMKETRPLDLLESIIVCNIHQVNRQMSRLFQKPVLEERAK